MDYYTPLSDKAFQELKEKARETWEQDVFTEDTHEKYRNEKLSRIDIENIEDNWAYIINMFDPINKNRLYHRLSVGTLDEIATRLLDANITEYMLISEIITNKVKLKLK